MLRLLSMRTETPEGGVVVRGGALFGGLLVKRSNVVAGGERWFGVPLLDPVRPVTAALRLHWVDLFAH